MSYLQNVSDVFDPSQWKELEGFEFQDITYHRAVNQGTVRIAFDRTPSTNCTRRLTTPE